MRCAAIWVLWVVLIPQAQAQKVSVQNGNVCLVVAGETKKVTSSGRDSEPVLAPDGKWIVFIRTVPGKKISTGSGDAKETQLWQMRADGKEPACLVRSKSGDKMEAVLAGFSQPQFSTNGKLVYFLSEAWATSGALHVVDTTNGKEHFVCPAAQFEVVRSGEYRDDLLVQQHRYFIGGGSYDWFWLLKPDGTEVGPVGEDTENFKSTYLKE
jgi:dipeptidyl aminopeptidase/acylaminoacyl peptidase